MHVKFFLLALSLIVGLSFFLLREQGPQSRPPVPGSAVSPPKAALPPASPVLAPGPTPSLPAGLSAEVIAFRSAEPVKRVERFYAAESKRVGEIDQDPELTARRLAAVAAELNAAEIDWLKGAALDRKRPGDGRFFAAYLLAQAPGPATVAALKEVALSPVPASKNQGLVELERQVRAQATEGLGHARGVAEARDSLLDVVQFQKDEFVRDRAHRSLHEWRTGKRVQEQDEEALRKVMEKSDAARPAR